MVFDLDPDEGLDFQIVKRAAFDIKALLDSADLPSFAMITGGKGIHIVLNVKRKHTWDEIKGFSGDVAEQIAALDPKRFVANMSKAQAQGPHLHRLSAQWPRRDGDRALLAARARDRADRRAGSWAELKTIPSASRVQAEGHARASGGARSVGGLRRERGKLEQGGAGEAGVGVMQVLLPFGAPRC